MITQYPPKGPQNGLYLVRILSFSEDRTAIYLYYDIAIGESAGWGSYYHYSNPKLTFWPLVWRIDRTKGASVLSHLFSILAQSTSKSAVSLQDAVGLLLWLDIKFDCTTHRSYIKHSYARNAFQVSSKDISVSTEDWRHGHPDRNHALILADLADIPVILADTHEKQSPMVEWCAQHGILLLPTHFQFGDYTSPNQNIVIDRKASIDELYDNFMNPKNRERNWHTAIMSKVEEKKLIYVVSTQKTDSVNTLLDLQNWRSPVGCQRSGGSLYRWLEDFRNRYSHIDFCFVPEFELCQTIYDLLLKK